MLIAGLGKSGISAAKLALSRGMEVFAFDGKKRADAEDSIGTLSGDIKISYESDGMELIDEVSKVVVSPGISFKGDFVKTARDRGKDVVSEIEFAANNLNIPVIAVTGTNGKTTVTKLIAAILREGGMNAVEAGNIGTPLSDIALGQRGVDFAVCEVSSFQLELIKRFKPFVSILLNVTPDHLNRYDSIEEYFGTKARIFENQDSGDFAVINADDPLIKENLPKLGGETFVYSRVNAVAKGAYVKLDSIFFRYGTQETEIIPLNEIKMKGAHNIENILAAVCCAMACKVNKESIAQVLGNFVPPAHRMEDAGEINGIRFINDSKATNVDALKRALESFSEKIVLIAGGRDKEGKFSILREEISAGVRLVIVIGEAGEKIENAFGDIVSVVKGETLKDAVALAFDNAEEGDVVLLSPGCASFDMFESFEHRGDEFKKYVRELNGSLSER